MQAHIVGGGFGGLAAAALLIRNAEMSGADITIYEADELLGGGFFLGGNAASGYNLPGSVFDKEFRCTFDLLKSIPSARNPAISVTEDFFAFNESEPYQDRAHIFDRNGQIVHGPRFGLSLRRRPLPRAGRTDARSDAGRAAHRGVLFQGVFRDRILVALVDHHGVAAAAQRHRVSALHEPLPVFVRRPLRHDGRDAHAAEPAPKLSSNRWSSG